ncbi:hypothetical protein GJ744_008599 [Endocarpon pusillum]|uniref:Nephrocystin 3-like N-terminal domain-containing protein n=1 Tax=Endocarpon pusillum TaxID=364733 RepID=A0A8H7AGU6_9EURO|nr:hypothetical protein GJ744_008599 [Endocarpon pusillum]
MNSVTNPAAELRLRDRLLRPFFSRSRGRLPSPQSLTSPPSSTLPASSPTTLSNTLSNALSTDEIVDRAWKQLSDHERSILQPFRASCGSTSGALEHCLAATIQQRQVWEGKRWTITFGNRTITVKEEADKIVRWLDRFKAVGDVAVNADPVHAGLPWAGVRLLLEVAISDANQMAALLVGCETAMYMIHRLKAYVDFLSQLPATLTRSNFETVLIAMHAMILAFLACALEKYQQSTLRRTFTALWHASDVQDFERDCNQRGASLEIEASNCDRTLAEQDRRRLGQIYQDLHKVLTNIAQIHHMQETLERLERKLDLSRLKSVEGAPFDAYSQVHRGCHPATRVDLLRSIQDWAQQPGGKSIFWLNGGAGTGKSTISYTVAQQLANQGWGTNIALGASFFFKRGESDRGSAALLFPTIVRQLAKKIDGLDVLVAKAIDADTDIGNKALGEQFARLIRAPLQQLLPVRTHPVYVIVLDALDECAPRDISTVLQLWSTLPDFAKDHLRVFLTSRPDLPVLSGFDEISVNVRIDLDLLEMTRATIKNDIFIFLQTAFVEIRQKYNRRPLSRIFLHDDWPDDVMIQELAQMATPLFIVAATVCLFVGDRNWDPRERLKTVLDLRRTGQMSQMGQTYLPVLKQILMDVSDRSDEDKLYREFRVVVGAIVTVAEPLSEVALEELLHMPRGSVALRLQPLQSVLDIPKDPEAVIRPLHLSFGEYLTGQEVQNEPFGVDAAATHRMLWRHCLRILSGPHGLHENMCGLNYPGQRQSTVSSTQREMYLPPVVRYASRYWVHHVQASTYRLCDQDEIHVFLEKHFLHWLEALSFMDRLADAIASVTTLQSVVAVEDSTGVASFLQDARRFILANRYIGEQAPLQLYSSAVIFAPQASITRNVCGQVPAWIVQSPATPTTWSLELQKLEGHTNEVNAVAFSHDSSLLASASGDQTVRLWNPATGQEVQKLEGHTSTVYTIAFSHNNSLLASASSDQTVRLWNPATGQEVQKLVHNDRVIAVAFSHDSSLLASASDDQTVRLWNPATGQEVQKLEGHNDWVRAVAFSHDSSLLASASDDKTVRLWNPATGQEVQKLEGHTRGVSAVAFSHNSSLLASASYDHTLRLWNPATGHEVQKFDNLDLILEIGFTAGNKALLTDKGLIKIDSSYSSNLDTGPNSCDALMLRDGWVEYEGKQILWLPQEYRSAVSAIRQNLIAFGLGTGPVAFLRIEYT